MEEKKNGSNQTQQNNGESKKEGKHRILMCQIDLDAVDQSLSKVREIPDVLDSWEKASPSKEYGESLTILLTFAKFIAFKLNDGPETKDSVVKRAVTLKMILSAIVEQTYLDGYHKYGLLYELLNDKYMTLGGRIQMDSRIVKVLRRIEEIGMKKSNEKNPKKVEYLA